MPSSTPCSTRDLRGPGRLHFRLTFPVALTTFRRELACVSPRTLDGFELAGAPQPSELTLGSVLEVSPILLCRLASTFPAEVVHISGLIVIGPVAPFCCIVPNVVLLRNSARPRFAEIRIGAYRFPYESILLERVPRLVRNVRTGL